jgi:hypothetical protein
MRFYPKAGVPQFQVPGFQVPNREDAARFGAGNLGFDHRRRDSVFNLELGTLKLWNY